MMKKMNERGSVLVAVLWLLAMLSVFSWAVARQASQELLFGQWVRERVMGRALVRAAVQRVILELQQDKFKTFDALNENWASNMDAFKDVPVGGGRFSVICPQDDEIVYGACDESARISINYADEQLLTNTLRTADPKLEEAKAKEIAQAIIDWRDKDTNPLADGVESDYYEETETPYYARNNDFQSVDELSMVKGMTPELLQKLRPLVTVYSGGVVNFNTAPHAVLMALGLTDMHAKKVIDFRRGADGKAGTSDDEVFQDIGQITPLISAGGQFSGEEYKEISNAISRGWLTVSTQAFRVHAKAGLNRESRKTDTSITCVINRDGSILYWKEGTEVS